MGRANFIWARAIIAIGPSRALSMALPRLSCPPFFFVPFRKQMDFFSLLLLPLQNDQRHHLMSSLTPYITHLVAYSRSSTVQLNFPEANKTCRATLLSRW